MLTKIQFNVELMRDLILPFFERIAYPGRTPLNSTVTFTHHEVDGISMMRTGRQLRLTVTHTLAEDGTERWRWKLESEHMDLVTIQSLYLYISEVLAVVLQVDG